MRDQVDASVIEIVQETLRQQSGNADLVVGPDDSMETLAEWDSLSFMAVFTAINFAFGLDPDFDDAIHYISVPSLCAYLGPTTGA